LLNAHLGRPLRQALFGIAHAFVGPLQAIPSSIAFGAKRKGFNDVLPRGEHALTYFVKCKDAITLASLSFFGCGLRLFCDGELSRCSKS
jgi:hypothetical protein